MQTAWRFSDRFIARVLFTSLLIAGWATELPAVVAPPCDDTPVTIGTHTVVFAGVVYDATNDTSTWFYTITSGKKPAISHVTFELLCPTIRITGAGIWSGSLPDISYLPKAGKPEPSSYPASPEGDPTTKLTGLKFDLGFKDNQTRNYYFTVDGQYAPDFMNVALKAGSGFTSGYICGPSASCETVELPEPSVALTKWATPQTYSAMDQEIIFTFKVENTGNVPLYNLTIADDLLPVPGAIAELAPGEVDDTTFSATYTITAADMLAGYVDNHATVTGVDENATQVTAEDTEKITSDVAVLRIRPILECVTDNGDGTYTAYFGYLNENAFPVEVPLSSSNRFVGGNPNRDPITTFAPGRSGYWPDAAFEVVFFGGNLVWNLQGRTSTASAGSSPCANHIFLDKEWRDADGQPLTEPPPDLPSDYAIIASSSLGSATGTYAVGSSSLSVAYPAGSTGLKVPVGETYSVQEIGLPPGWQRWSGEGTFTAGDGYAVSGHQGLTKYYLHTMVNQALPEATPGLRLIKTATPEQYQTVGDTITYQFVLENIGTVVLSNIFLTDPLVSVMGGPLPSLAPGQVDTSTFSAVYTITHDDLLSSAVTNTATATAQGPGPEPVEATDDAVVTRNGPAPVWGSIGSRVWLDENSDGIQQPGEPGVEGVVVRLLSATGEVLASTVTDSQGDYLFEHLVAGTYVVTFTRPSGYVYSELNVGGDTGLDSDADPVTGTTGVIELAPGADRRDIDAGLVVSTASLRLTKTGTFVPGTIDPWDACDIFGLTRQFNAFVFGDFEVASQAGDTEGRLAVGGTLSITNGYSVGLSVYGDSLPLYFGAQTDSLIIVGDFHDTYWEVNGNIVYGGERFGPRRFTTQGNVMRKQTPVTLDAHGNVPADGSGMTFTQIFARLAARSAELAAMTNRGVVELGRSPGPYDPLVLTGDDPVLNVFNVTAELWNRNGSDMYLTAPASATVLINITGGPISMTNGWMYLSGVTRDKVLMHYVDATMISSAGIDHEGSVLALYADCTFAGAAINGRAVIGGNVSASMGFEFHNFDFTGNLCLDGQTPPVPPSIVYTFTVENDGNTPLTGIVIDDPLIPVTGGPLELPAGATNTTTFSATLSLDEARLAIGGITNVATAIGTTGDGGTITATDDDIQIFPVEEDPDDPPPPDEWPPDSLPDFVVQSVMLSPSPTLVLSSFRTEVRITNAGDRPGVPGTVAVWPSLDDWDNNPASAPGLEVTDNETLLPGESRVYDLGQFGASAIDETFHVIARVNRAETETEYSYGNNFGGVTYSLQPVEVDVEMLENGTVSLSWNSAEGFYYFVDRAPGLDNPFEDIAINVPATPPLNTHIDTNPPSTPAFYRVWGYQP